MSRFITALTADNLDCATSEKEYLKTNLGDGEEYRAVYVTDRAPGSSRV